MGPEISEGNLTGEKILDLAKYSVKHVIHQYHKCAKFMDELVSQAVFYWYDRNLVQNINFSQYNDRQIRSYIIRTFYYRMRDFCFKGLRETGVSIDDLNPVIEETGAIGNYDNFVELETPFDFLFKKRIIYALEDAVAKLPKAQRKAFVKRELEGRSNQDYAQSEGITGAAATQNYNRAIERLKQNKTLKEFIK